MDRLGIGSRADLRVVTDERMDTGAERGADRVAGRGPWTEPRNVDLRRRHALAEDPAVLRPTISGVGAGSDQRAHDLVAKVRRLRVAELDLELPQRPRLGLDRRDTVVDEVEKGRGALTKGHAAARRAHAGYRGDRPTTEEPHKQRERGGG